jgi:hypothetical protein
MTAVVLEGTLQALTQRFFVCVQMDLEDLFVVL